MGVSLRCTFAHIILSKDRGAFARVPVHEASEETGEDGGCTVQITSRTGAGREDKQARAIEIERCSVG